jgi:hypothetical protein
MASYPSGFPTNTLRAHLSPPTYAPHALPISFFLILPPVQYWVRSTDHSAPHYATFSIPATSSLLRPNTLLNTLLSNTISLRLWHNNNTNNKLKCSHVLEKRPGKSRKSTWIKPKKSTVIIGYPFNYIFGYHVYWQHCTVKCTIFAVLY